MNETKPKLFIAIPTHDGRIHLAGMYGLIQMGAMLSNAGVEFCFEFAMSSDICQVRAQLAEAFLLREDYTHMLFIDTDLGFDPTAAMKLLASGYPVCGGAYPKKKTGTPEFTLECYGESVNGFRRTRYLGAGFLLIHRAVIQKIRAKYPELTALDEATGSRFTSYFQNGIIDGRYRSEDTAFCYRWTQLGGTVWVLEDAMFTHYGPFGWEGNLKDLLALTDNAKPPEVIALTPKQPYYAMSHQFNDKVDWLDSKTGNAL